MGCGGSKSSDGSEPGQPLNNHNPDNKNNSSGTKNSKQSGNKSAQGNMSNSKDAKILLVFHTADIAIAKQVCNFNFLHGMLSISRCPLCQ